MESDHSQKNSAFLQIAVVVYEKDGEFVCSHKAMSPSEADQMVAELAALGVKAKSLTIEIAHEILRSRNPRARLEFGHPERNAVQ